VGLIISMIERMARNKALQAAAAVGPQVPLQVLYVLYKCYMAPMKYL
jgi:formiminotetrahydrofolate cyclodeaminase